MLNLIAHKRVTTITLYININFLYGKPTRYTPVLEMYTVCVGKLNNQSILYPFLSSFI